MFSASAAWPLFRAFGATVYLHWLTILVPISFYAGLAKTDMTPGEAGLWTAVWTFSLFFVIWTHEMGHITAARHVGVTAKKITLWPLGGLAHLDRRSPSPGAEMFISAAGPAVHVVWFLIAGAPYLYFVRGHDFGGARWPWMLEAFVGMQIGLLVFNLLPMYPMDGGSILRGWLARKMHANRASLYTAYIGLAGAVVLGVAGLSAIMGATDGAGLLANCGWIALTVAVGNGMACRALLAEARWGDGPYDMAREPWADSIPEASWTPENDTDTAEPVLKSARPERTARASRDETSRKRAAAPRRDEAAAATTAAPQRRLQDRIDQLLDRINEAGGIEKLTDAERKELADASERLKRDGKERA